MIYATGPGSYLTTRMVVSNGGKFLRGSSKPSFSSGKQYDWIAVLTTPGDDDVAFKTISGFSAPWIRKNSVLNEFVIPKNSGVRLKEVVPF